MLIAYDRVRNICRDASKQVNTPNAAKQIKSGKTVAAVERLARSDRRIIASVTQWDANPWRLNTPQGVVDLKTGKLKKHRTNYYMTKITAVAPDDNCPIPTWLAFLKRITDSADTTDFLQRMSGYMLTGMTTEHALFFLIGPGANGKSTLINVLLGILGDYHRTAPIETFIASRNERHPTDLAGLHGARLVTSIETEKGHHWSESKIKALTGGDKIAARFMRQDFFEYVPQFKIAIAGNHRPSLRSVDEAIRRRVHLIPFDVVIPHQERDKNLGDRLRDEWPGILAWMIRGCLEWQRKGLAAPQAVVTATDAYMLSEDAFAAWMEEAGVRSERAWEPVSRLYSSWKSWAERSGEIVGSKRQFSQDFEMRGFTFARRDQGRGFYGFKLQAMDFYDDGSSSYGRRSSS
jgi:putative DNA primase/helicase